MSCRFFALVWCALLACTLLFAQQTPPQVIYHGDATMVPLQAVANWLHAQLTFTKDTGSIVVQGENLSIRMTVNSRLATSSGKTLTLDEAPLVQDNVLYAPVNFLRKVLDLQVTLDAEHGLLTFAVPSIKEPLRFQCSLPDPDTQRRFTEAVEGGDLDTVKSMLAQFPKLVSLKNKDGMGILLIAAIHRQWDMAASLIEAGANPKETTGEDWMSVIHIAAMDGQQRVVELCTKSGVDINTKATFDVTPLHCACFSMLFTAFNREDPKLPSEEQRLKLIQWLLEHDANPNAVANVPIEVLGQNGDALKKMAGFGTPMMFAAAAENTALEEMLQKHGATAIAPELGKAMKQFIQQESNRARQTRCTNNQKQIAVACQIWIQENGEKFPIADDNLWKALNLPTLTLRCPTKADVEMGYGYNAWLSGKKLGDLKHPEKVLMFADCGSADHLIHSLKDIDQTRHDGGFIAAFCDGHLEYFKAGADIVLQEQ